MHAVESDMLGNGSFSQVASRTQETGKSTMYLLCAARS